jgi:hypothetical protein
MTRPSILSRSWDHSGILSLDLLAETKAAPKSGLRPFVLEPGHSGDPVFSDGGLGAWKLITLPLWEDATGS